MVLTGIFQSLQSLKKFAQYVGPVVSLESERSRFKALSEPEALLHTTGVYTWFAVTPLV